MNKWLLLILFSIVCNQSYSSALVELNRSEDFLIIKSHIVCFGTEASSELCTKISSDIQTLWSTPSAQIVFEGQSFEVRFEITSEYLSEEQSFELAKGNRDPRINFIRIENSAPSQADPYDDEEPLPMDTTLYSYVHEIGGNAGFYIKAQVASGVSTSSHEFGHLLGLEHPPFYQVPENPHIMLPRYTYDGDSVRILEGIVDAEMRAVHPLNIASLQIVKLGSQYVLGFLNNAIFDLNGNIRYKKQKDNQ